MNFRKVNNLTGWAVFFVAFATYFLTREARGSLWDCGEFVASAAKMQLPHPPGAPLFVLMGRFFIILFGDNGQTAASAVNFMSALVSAATILFLFWSVTHFARKMFVSAGETLSGHQLFAVMAAGVVGGLAYTFCDSFWFSAVEGEVYAFSSFFTALVFWAMLKWEHADENAGMDPAARLRSDRWIVFLFFMMGLSIGVHILNLLTIPAIVMIYYYRRYNVTTWGAVAAFVIGCVITGLVQVAIIQYSMKAAGLFDVYFVNSVGMPFFSGFAIYFIALAALIVWALTFKEKNISKTKLTIFFVLFLALSFLPFIVSVGSGGMQVFKFLVVAGAGVLIAYFLKASALKALKLSLWCYAFIMLGYFMYFTSMIRSNANPAIDMNNVDNPINLVYYLGREQYGSAPIVYGPHFLASPKIVNNQYAMKDGEMRYVKGDKKYIEIGRQREYEYDSKDKQIFPRIWDSSNDQYHFDTYVEWLNLGVIQAPEYSMVVEAQEDMVQLQNQEGKTQSISIPDNYSTRVRRGQVVYPGDRLAVKVPTMGDNIEWFFSYQNSFMYWRYFMWNFSGKQNDIQGASNKRDGNWITGISFIDNTRLGDQKMMPESLQKNKAKNKFFLLPFILGIVGCVFQFLRNRKDWVVNFLLFMLTGMAVVIYLNQPGNQPRERDYAYVGSFYAFAIWIGLAVVGFVRMAKEKEDKFTFTNVLIGGSALTFFIALMSSAPGDLKDMLLSSVLITAVFAAVTAAVTYGVRAIASNGTNEKMLNIATTVICMIAPIIMAQQTWDDHDRSEKTLAPDLAKDYLESCAPNAIIFTFGDNDTYPLWYAQEVEGVRPDIRIINNSLLGIDWYINQLRYKINDAPGVPITWTEEQVEGHNREYLMYQPDSRVPDKFYTLDEFMALLGQPNLDPDTKRDVGPETFPVRKFILPVDVNKVRSNGTVTPGDSVLSEIRFEIGRNSLQRNDLIILNIIAANKWDRPIYFTSPYGELGFGDQLRKDGLAYRLVPAKLSYPQSNWEANNAMRQLGLGGTQIRDNNLDTIYRNLMTKYEFGGADKKGVYFDEENRRHLNNIRSLFAEVAGNLADAGRKDEAVKILDKVEAGINPANLPYGMTSRFNSHNQTTVIYLEACYKAGRKDLAEKVKASLLKDLNDQKQYYDYLDKERPEIYKGFERTEQPINSRLLQVVEMIVNKYDPKPATQGSATEGQKQINTNPAATGDSGTNKTDTP